MTGRNRGNARELRIPRGALGRALVTRTLNRVQSGYIFTYAFAMVLGVAILITWVTIVGGAD